MKSKNRNEERYETISLMEAFLAETDEVEDEADKLLGITDSIPISSIPREVLQSQYSDAFEVFSILEHNKPIFEFVNEVLLEEGLTTKELAKKYKIDDLLICVFIPYMLAYEIIRSEITNIVSFPLKENQRVMLKDFIINWIDARSWSVVTSDNADDGLFKRSLSFTAVHPKTFSITNNLLANQLTKGMVGEGEVPLVVMPQRKNRDKVITYNTLTYDDKNIEINGRRAFTAYDRAVNNAIASAYEAGNKIITPELIFRILTGNKNAKPHPQQIKAIDESLSASRRMHLRVDFTDEARARNMDIENAVVDTYLFNADEISVTVNGRRKKAYSVNAVPALYRYAQLTRQVISVPIDILNTGQAVSNTDDLISIREYLIRRIEIMKHEGNKCSNKIIYDTIFMEAGITNAEQKVQRKRHRDNIKLMLSVWVKMKYIKGFEEFKVKRVCAGVLIEV